FKTGELAKLDENGRVALIGRAKDIISRCGIKIAPLEIDNLLAGHPDVAAARIGEVIRAVIVSRNGATFDPAALRAWLLERAERYMVPEVFYVCDVLP